MNKINATQQKILTAAKKVYCRVGYSSSTFQMIAEESGTSRSLINYYYPKKQDILVDVLGRHLDSIHEYVLGLGRYNELMTYMLTNTLFVKSMLKTEETTRFYCDMLKRNDRDLSPYRNYNKLYIAIITAHNINMTEEDLLYKEISIFGASTELSFNYINHTITITEKELLEYLMHDVCNLLQISNFVIDRYLKDLWIEYEKLDKKDFPLFD